MNKAIRIGIDVAVGAGVMGGMYTGLEAMAGDHTANQARVYECANYLGSAALDVDGLAVHCPDNNVVRVDSIAAITEQGRNITSTLLTRQGYLNAELPDAVFADRTLNKRDQNNVGSFLATLGVILSGVSMAAVDSKLSKLGTKQPSVDNSPGKFIKQPVDTIPIR
jgi:hypothetical protein